MTKIFSEISLVFQCHNQSPEHTQRSDRDQAQDELRGGEGRTTSKYGLSSAIFDYSLFDHLIHFSKRRSKASAKPHTMVISTFLNDFSSTAKVRRYLIWVEGLFIFLFFFLEYKDQLNLIALASKDTLLECYSKNLSWIVIFQGGALAQIVIRVPLFNGLVLLFVC